MTTERAKIRRNQIATEIAHDLALDGYDPEGLEDDVAIIARLLHKFEIQVRRDERADVAELLGRPDWLAWSVPEPVLVEAGEVITNRNY